MGEISRMLRRYISREIYNQLPRPAGSSNRRAGRLAHTNRLTPDLRVVQQMTCRPRPRHNQFTHRQRAGQRDRKRACPHPEWLISVLSANQLTAP